MAFFKKVDPKKQIHLVVAQLNSGEYMDAMKNCEKLMQQFPRHAEGARLMGQVCEKLGNDRKALGFFKIAVDGNPSYANYLAYGNLCRRLDESGKASELLEKALAASPDSIEFMQLLAEIYEERGIWPRAVAMRKGIYDRRSDDPDALYRLAKCTHRARLLEETAMLCTRLLNREPDHAKGLRLFAECMLYRNMHERAIELYSRALQAQPDDWEGHFQLAEIYLSVDQADNAKRHFQFCIRHNKEHREAHRNLIDTYKANRDWLEAEIVLKHLVGLGESQELLIELGDVCAAQKEYNAAVTTYQQARSAGKISDELDAKYIDAAIRSGRAEEVTEMAHRLSSGNVFNVQFQHLYALCLMAGGEKASATELVKGVTASEREFPEFCMLRAKLLGEAGLLPGKNGSPP
ncbi:MAG: tetratricopeptide repeat protein [Planctomycetota bacterium]|nr:tetratricopeptide repeat protein [Planctomycetota bacterium]